MLSVERNWISNLSQFSAFININFDNINWAGFYLTQTDGDLLLGPFQGNPACVRIAQGKGVCGTAAATQTIQVIADVDQFAGHIACDSASRSEVVIPLIIKGDCFAVLDIDSPILNRFDQQDADGLVILVKSLIDATDWE